MDESRKRKLDPRARKDEEMEQARTKDKPAPDTVDADDDVEMKDSTAAKSVFSMQLLKLYYDRLFPYKEMFRWLSYGNDPASDNPLTDKLFFKKREFSFTLENDVYVRYRCFLDKDELIRALKQHQPHKIDIGPVNNMPPTHHVSNKNFGPVQKELVFDIDMTDYDNVRSCCSGASICLKCWPLMTAAIKVLDVALREDFGFEHLLWIYSGRRGVHCWVCDERARVLSNSARGAVVEYLSLYFGNEANSSTRGLTTPLHPSLERAFEILEPRFRDIMIRDQKLLDDPKSAQAVLDLIPVPDLIKGIKQNWKKMKGLNRWEYLKKCVNQWAQKRSKGMYKLRTTVANIVFAYTYPRLDVNVSKQMHHLLKSPFSAHPKTGRICVPINPDKADDFNPLTVPSLDLLEEELNTNAGATNARKRGDGTSLEPFMKFFRSKFLKPLEAENVRRRKQQSLNTESTDF